jgi:hypothetical protein
MKKFIIVAFCTYITSAVFAQDITGSWAGKLDIQSTKLSIVFHIGKTIRFTKRKWIAPIRVLLD